MILVIYFLLVYGIGFSVLYHRAKKKREKLNRFAIFLGAFLSFTIYVAIIEIKQGTVYFLLPCLIFLFFFLNYRRHKTLLINGFLFNLFLLSFGLYLIYHFSVTKNLLVFSLLVLLSVIPFFFIVFGTWSFILLLYWNARIMLRREGRSLSNLFILILALFLTFLSLYNQYVMPFLPDWLAIFLAVLPFILVYFSFMFLNFLTISLIYQFNRPGYPQDFIIVLGAGLLNGETVTPLLAQRIDRALTFYQQQVVKIGTPPKIIFSGGQGPDEKIPEAVAMRNYAIDLGYPLEDLLIEDQSTTTFENMKFSKSIIDKLKPEQARVIFTSNNYHIFRGGVYAYKNHLKAEGLGSKTALYYLPTAFLREFIAMIAMHRNSHFIFLGCTVFVFLLLSIVTFIAL